MRIDIITLFPEMFAGPFSASIVRRAIERGFVSIVLHDLRDWAHDRRRTVDDEPFGGGPGMILKPDPIFEAVDELRSEQAEIILLSPNGDLFNQVVAGELAREHHLILICGHYEGVDERVADHLATRVISVGDYVLTGGEIPAMAITDAVVRLLPGALGCADSTREEAHAEGVLEYPQYTRPAEYRGLGVPEVLRSGHHQELAAWKRREALRRTWQRRRDLLDPPRLAEMQRLGLLDASPSEDEGGHACG
ncbi:MAG: tRNA (guanosine(37)-N1)-methyltransferase TrmD [Chloroflexi bacterium]|nr:tRNA (guanosine(37)-N1)-methyltransferase TrmD [Chloroflexota bacterium]